MGSSITEKENAFFHKGRNLALSSLGLNILLPLPSFFSSVPPAVPPFSL
jgi:hypothetical protein